ncbi:MAG: hypothetical protein HGA71_14725 [Azonexaceae bacterium]|nr:hypothetical protein [Azonexaceae bacterium]
MQISGHCQCGNISFNLECSPGPTGVPARACVCSFCSVHKCVWTSFADAKLAVQIQNREWLERHTFATETAEFHICKQCGDVPFVTSLIDGNLFAAVNVNVLQGLSPGFLQRAQVDFEGEGLDARLERRRQAWIADVTITDTLSSVA